MSKHIPSGPWLSGQFKPKNPQKYQGNVKEIYYRSSFELTAFKICDTEPGILAWNSEEEIIPYTNPRTGKTSRYMMDLKLWTKNINTGEVQITLVEIKPEVQTQPPRRGNKKNETYLKECATWSVNQAKWQATEEYCRQRGWNFVKWTEEHLVPGAKHDKDIQAKMVEHRKQKREMKKARQIRSEKVRAVGKKLADQMRSKLGGKT